MAKPPVSIEFWFEFASTYSYPAAVRVEQLARERGVPVVWRPFLLGPIFKQQGWNDSPFNLQEAKGRYMWRDLERICKSQRIAFRRPTAFPRGGLLAARVACRNAGEPWLPDFVRSVYRANFAEDRDISLARTIFNCLAPLCSDAAARIELAGSDESKSLLRAQTEKAAELGIFGAPSFRVCERGESGELFWGNDRLEDALSWAASRKS